MTALRKWGAALALVLFVIGVIALLATLVCVGILPGEFVHR